MADNLLERWIAAANNPNRTNKAPHDEMDYIYADEPQKRLDKYNENLRVALSHPQKPLEERLTDISLEEFSQMLDYIYDNQDYNGSLVSRPRFLRWYICPEDMWEPNNVEEANMLVHEFVSTHIEMLFTAEDPFYTLGPIYRDPNGKKRFLIVWYGLREPPLPAILKSSRYITCVAHWYLEQMKTDLDFSWMF